MRVLLTNDDGADSPFLPRVIERLSALGRVRSKTEHDLVLNIIEKARWVPESLMVFALGQIRDGVRTGTVGRVSMDMLAVDLTPVPAAGFGSEVTLWGHGPRGTRLSIDEVAHGAGTIGYELMCALARRVPVTVDHQD